MASDNQAAAHFGDPCVKCGSTPWGDAWRLGRAHAMCGQSRINPEFWSDMNDRRAYVAGYDGVGA